MKPYSPVATIFFCPFETGIHRLWAVDFIDDRTNHPEDTVYTFPGKEIKIRVVGVATRMSRADALALAAAYASGILISNRIEFNQGQETYDVTRRARTR